MLFVMGVSIYSSRIVLNVLGASDYGLYNVVGGVVAMLSFLNGAASGAISRFLTFYLGKKDSYRFRQAFSSSFYILLGIAFILVILAETVGLWFLKEKMIIEPERMDAAIWVYHLSILSCFVTFFQVPFNACIIAHERMKVYAYVGVIEALLKLVILYILSICEYDKLKSYSLLLLLISVFVATCYCIYCRKNFKDCKISKVKDFSIFKEILKYAGWDTLGSLTGIAQTQGINVVLNLFFSTVINAARGVAYQIDAAVNNFIINFLTALRPQIVKSYAAKDYDRMELLLFYGGKYAFLLFACLSVPIIIEAPYLLKLWLINPPEYSVIFLQLVLVNHFISVINQVLGIGVHAVGDVKRLNLYAGTISILKLPLAYILLYCGLGPEWAFICLIPMTFICMIADLIVLRLNITFPVWYFFYQLFLKNTFLVLLPTFITWEIIKLLPEGFIRLIITTILYLILLFITVFSLGLNSLEKNKLKGFKQNILKKY